MVRSKLAPSTYGSSPCTANVTSPLNSPARMVMVSLFDSVITRSVSGVLLTLAVMVTLPPSSTVGLFSDTVVVSMVSLTRTFTVALLLLTVPSVAM